MTERFNNKVVVVTGGTSGIGLAAAKAFVAEGAAVFITGRRQEVLDAAVEQIGGRVTGVRADMSDLADIDRVYDAVQQQHAQIDVLFANAGGGDMLPLGAITNVRRLFARSRTKEPDTLLRGADREEYDDAGMLLAKIWDEHVTVGSTTDTVAPSNSTGSFVPAHRLPMRCASRRTIAAATPGLN